jgi:hypothetical protein
MIETTSIELSKKLAGILDGKVESYFTRARRWDATVEGLISRRELDPSIWCETFPAYTACELMKFLPWYVDVRQIMSYVGRDEPTRYRCHGDKDKADQWFVDEIAANAIGRMILWLDGEGLLK